MTMSQTAILTSLVVLVGAAFWKRRRKPRDVTPSATGTGLGVRCGSCGAVNAMADKECRSCGIRMEQWR